MNKAFNLLNKIPLIVVLTILAIGLFFRTYQVIERFEFGHDADLYSWIVKDIVVNKHLRLVGQETSAPGIFIGPLFYYLIAPFFLLTGMEPIGALIPFTLISLLTIFSFYWVPYKLFNLKAGLISATLYAFFPREILLDRWIVPTNLTNIWSIWYFYCLINLVRGNFKVLPMLGLLIGLIWHVHIVLFPILITIPLAIILSKKIPSFKQIFLFALIIFTSSLPLLIFESRHGFSQTKNFLHNFTENFTSGNKIIEQRKIYLGEVNSKNEQTNFNQASKFIVDISPRLSTPGEDVTIKVTSKNPKYSTLIIQTDCGEPHKFEVGYSIATFNWSTKGCEKGEHTITSNGRVAMDPVSKKLADKFLLVLDKQNRNIKDLFLPILNISNLLIQLLSITIFLIPLLLWNKKYYATKEVIVLYAWICSLYLFFTLSSIQISEYYLNSIDIILIISLGLLFSLFHKLKLGKYILFIFLIFILIQSFSLLLKNNQNKTGYLNRKSVVEYISSDAKINNYPCFAISYISNPGENVGFRYLFWLNKSYIVKSENDGRPVYNIVIPEELSDNITKRFESIGVIRPTNVNNEAVKKACQEENVNVTGSVFGYVD